MSELTLDGLVQTIAKLTEEHRQSRLDRMFHGRFAADRLKERLERSGIFIPICDKSVPCNTMIRGVELLPDSTVPNDEIHFVDQNGLVMKIYNIGIDLAITEKDRTEITVICI